MSRLEKACFAIIVALMFVITFAVGDLIGWQHRYTEHMKTHRAEETPRP